jgi:hypothetical protein
MPEPTKERRRENAISTKITNLARYIQLGPFVAAVAP